MKKTIMLILILLLGTVYAATAKSQGPDILQGKYICIYTMIDKIAFMDCNNSYTANLLIGTKDTYILRNKKNPSFIMKCKTRKIIKCETLTKKVNYKERKI